MGTPFWGTVVMVLVAITDSSAILVLVQAVLFSLCGVCNAVLTATLAAWPPFAPAHSPNLILQVLHLVWEFPDVFEYFSSPPSSQSQFPLFADRKTMLGSSWPQGSVAYHSPG